MNIQQRGPRTFLLQWQAGLDTATGKYRRISETFHGTRAQAEKRWGTRQAELDRGIGLGQGVTFADVWSKWMTVKSHQCRASTMASYTMLGNTHILPQLGAKRLDKLTALDIQEAVTRWQAPGARRDTRGDTLSPRTVRYLRSLVVGVLDQAVRWQLVGTNVARLVETPKSVPIKFVWWTPEEGRRFLATAESHPLYIAFALALGTGLRRGEILGLRWTDIDETADTLTVGQTLSTVRGQLVFGPPKTPESRRTIPLDRALLKRLREHRQRQREHRILLGPDYQDHGLVVQSARGTPVGPRIFGRVFDRLQSAAGVPRIRLHDLRHTHASWLLSMGVDARTIADRLGHTQVSFTLQTYAHSTVRAQRDAVTKLGADLF